MEMASPGNRHCAKFIGVLSFPIVRLASDTFKRQNTVVCSTELYHSRAVPCGLGGVVE